jgi:hypothetical protein
MGLWGQAALGAGLSKVAGSYMKGQREKESQRTQQLQNDLLKLKKNQAEAESESSSWGMGVDAAINAMNNVGAGGASSLFERKTPTTPKDTSNAKDTSTKTIEATSSPTGMGAGKPPEASSEIPDAVPFADEDKNYYKEAEVSTQTSTQTASPEVSKEKQESLEYQQHNDKVLNNFKLQREADKANKEKKLVKGMPGYDDNADMEVGEFASRTRVLENLYKGIEKIAPIKKQVQDRIQFLLAKAEQTGNQAYKVEASKVYAKYGKALSEMEHKEYMQAISFAATEKDEAALNLLTSVTGLSGDKSATFDWNEETNKWDVLNGDGTLAYSTDELVMSLTDKDSYSKLQGKIREEVRKSEQAVKQAADIYRATNGPAKMWLQKNMLMAANLGSKDGVMMLDNKGLFGVGNGTPIFLTKKEVKRLKNGTSDLFLKNDDGTFVGQPKSGFGKFDSLIQEPANKKRMIQDANGVYVWVNTDDFVEATYRRYNPANVRTTINNYFVDKGNKSGNSEEESGEEESGNPEEE